MRNLVFLVAISIFSISAQAGSGAGGIIKIINNTDVTLKVGWGGLGCFGSYFPFNMICEGMDLEPNQEYTYSYNWGVTETWINAETGGELVLWEYLISTDAWETDECRLIRKSTNGQVVHSCKRL